MTGPLLDAWGSAASAEALARTLRPPAEALPAPTIGDRSAWDGALPRLRAVRERAQAALDTAWPQPLASGYARFFRDGDRVAYETATFARQHRLSGAVLVAAATGSDRWVDEAADGMVLLCEQSSWCWPAHEERANLGVGDRSSQADGTVLPDPDRPTLDLGAADVAAQLAWADHVLGPRLDTRYPGLRGRVRREVRTRVLDPFVRRRDWHWLGLDGDVHNWCPWICGNVLVAALGLRTERSERALAAALAVEGVDRYLAALPADGSVDEGYEYWWNGACRALEALDVLAHATGGALSADGVEVTRQTVRFPHRMHLGGPWYLNVADARARPPTGQPWHVPLRWATRLGEPEAARHAATQATAQVPPTAELGRALRQLTDPGGLTPSGPPPTQRDHLRAPTGEGEHEVPTPIVSNEQDDLLPSSTGGPPGGGPPLVASVWLPGIQVALARSAAGTAAGLALAVKGGHNGEHHNHNDVGNVVVAVDGVPVVVDAGRPTYTARTFGPDRYAIWTMQSTWHNVPEVRGVPQGHGRGFRARDVTVTDEPDRFAVRLDLARAYPPTGLEHWWRTATLDRRTGSVTVQDAWSFAETAASGTPRIGTPRTGTPATSSPTGPSTDPSCVRYLLAGRVEWRAPGRVIVYPADGARATLLRWDPVRAAATLTVRELDDPLLATVWGDRLTRLELRLPESPRGSLTVEVTVEVEVPQ